MGDETAIQWAHSTFNPWLGCEKVSPACAACYAEVLVSGRMGRRGTWGKDGVRQRTSDSNWKKPLKWEREAEAFAADNGGSRRRVFCASLADVFEPRPELDSWRLELFTLIADTPSLDWLLLTKRPEQAAAYLRWLYETPIVLSLSANFPFGQYQGEWATRDGIDWGVLPNVWIGTSIENTRFAWRADVLRTIPAPVRFLSCEPLLGSLFDEGPAYDCSACHGSGGGSEAHLTCGTCNGSGVEHRRRALNLEGIAWVICGGESGGRNARPMHADWARELRDACWSAEYPCQGCNGLRSALCSDCEARARETADRPAYLFKQWGSWTPIVGHLNYDGYKPEHVHVFPKGATDPEPWFGFRDGSATVFDRDAVTADGRALIRYAGAQAHSGGRILDGREWNEVPLSPLHPRRKARLTE